MKEEPSSNAPSSEKNNPKDQPIADDAAPPQRNQPVAAAASPAERAAPTRQHASGPALGNGQATVLSQSSLDLKNGEAAIQPTLEVVVGSASQRTIFLGKETVKIGRVNYNNLVLNDKKVSRTHAQVYFEKGHYVVEDLKSSNGVSVDGSLVNKIVLRSGNRITLGDTVLLFTQRVPDMSLEDKITFIGNNPLFNWLDDETKRLLGESLVMRFFPKDTTVVRQKTLVESMYFLYAGGIRVVEINEEGGERNIDEISPGDFFGERALLAGESANYSIVSNLDSHVLELQKERLNELLLKKPEISKAFYRMVLKKLTTAPAQPGEAELLQDQLKTMVTSTDVQIIGEDKRIKEAKKKIEKLAQEDQTVLVVGAIGTGKRMFARYFHQFGPHPDYPYVEISLAELDPIKVGPAIFGIEAEPEASHMVAQLGYLEIMGKGTLAIAHAELLDAHQQSKLVTYLKFGWFHRVYGRESVKAKTHVSFMASGTEAEVLAKLIPELRELLKDRAVSVPPLIQRLKDIPLLAEHYLNVYARKNGKHISGLSREATEKLVSYAWPGNIEELENVIQRAAIVASEDVIIPGDLIFVVPSEKEIHKKNLLRQDKIRDILRHPLVPKIFIWFNILMVVVMAGFTLYGGSRPADHPLQDFGNNPGMLITWLVWFPILPISAFLLGRIWCGVCPIAGIGDLASRIIRLNLPVPKFLKRMDFWMVVVSFLLLDYIEEFLAVAEKPWATGLLLVIIISFSVVFCMLFERKTFCRYVCPLAGMLGAYSTLSILEIRGNKKICQTQCGQHLCYKGTEQASGCPMFSYPASLTTNAECMLCLSCLKSCENRGVQLNLRPPLQELWHQAQPALSLSLFGVMLVGLMGRHQFPNLTFWQTLQQGLHWPEGLTHTLVYALFLCAAVVPFVLSSTLSAAASQEKVSENMAHYGMAFIPLALSGHLAHVFHEFLSGGIYEMLGYFVKLYYSVTAGIPIGSREVVVSHFIHTAVITFIKFMLISGGLLGSVIALVMIARRSSERSVMGRIMPHLILLLFFWIAYLFIFMSPTGAPAEVAAPAAAAGQPTAAAHSAAPTIPSSAVPAQPAAASAGQGLQTSGTLKEPTTTTAASFSLTQPDIKNSTSVPLSSAAVSAWLRSAQSMPGGKSYRLSLLGQVTGAPPGSQVQASLEIGTVTRQFLVPVDARGFFRGEIQLNNINQKIPLQFQLIDPKTKNVVITHRVVIF